MQKFTFHVINLPHTQTTAEYTHCAYTQKVRKFCNMMTDLGHDVYLYASEENEARVKELVTVISKEKQFEFFGDNDHTKNSSSLFSSVPPQHVFVVPVIHFGNGH